MAVSVSPHAPHQAWLVDLDGTLYRPGPVKRRMALELLWRAPVLFWPLRQVRRAHERLRAEPGLQGPVETPLEAQLRLAGNALGWTPERLRLTFMEWMVERPCRHLGPHANRPLIEELRQARSRGIRLALVSDYPAQAKLAALGVRELFEAVIANGEAPGPTRLKPDPAGYLQAAEALGCAPAQCLVIGDRQDADGRAAAAAGMGFRWIQSH